MPLLDWTVARLSKSQDEMRAIFKKLTVDNIELTMDGNYPIVKYGDFSFVIIDKNVIMRDTKKGESTTAFLGMRGHLKKELMKLIDAYKAKKTTGWFEKIKKENNNG